MFNFIKDIFKIRKSYQKHYNISEIIVADRKKVYFPIKEGSSIYRFGYMDSKNKIIIPCIFNNAMHFTEDGVAWVYKKSKLVLIDVYGNELFGRYKYHVVNDFNEGLCSVADHNTNLWGVIDLNGNEVVPCKYLNIKKYKFGYALAKQKVWNEKTGLWFEYWGFIDRKGVLQLSGFDLTEIKTLNNNGETIGLREGVRVKIFVNKEGKLEIENAKDDDLDYD